MNWHATILTLFPEAFPGMLDVSIIGRARAEGLWSLDTVQIRDHAHNKHRNVDDTPAGGGPGMVMRADVLAAAADSVDRAGRPFIYLSPRGKSLKQARVRELATGPGVILLCGRFEGVDQRFLDARDVEEVSIGDFVLAGGEVAAQTLIEACVRLIPGVLGASQSSEEESFESGLLEYPQYTRPRDFEGREIPPVLLSGDHEAVAGWRRKQALDITRARRPDLLPENRNEAGSNPAPDKKEDDQ
ncbi:tRNA (guanosine(37)-N1)-methyltransferase TrmD [Aquisalinus flavus]|uniref:tRNA (guanine-N(1)-)-methyltransferase n=1 Tax=Aquisalinus flavus TaxID=1526572 RepID=A0A8J2Y860_9PROT|nr:tRNA (guanosine(37)-N1)-methyltransferase TrmD [Aquisalinus flavus]MBD0425665.1 tRNA (guanosine(37)-N1)-methyltransferase TrmD [Aquisalinus flavus]UNE48721.1 tRNA (guanosine(37)-N1)-methyltransferase TrmD [Aquisalinus flavus]GGD14224.1 tRNA (guanine-N(1)-)-methyltransferase [Aquisalinus flavus]